MAQKAQIFQTALAGLRFDGAALSSGKVYFYSPGTTTAKTIYVDRNKQTTAANPYTLDSNGRAEIFGDGIYDVVVKTSAGVTKATWENVALQDASVYYDNVENYASLNAAITAIGSTPTRLVINSATTMTGNDTVPATLELDISAAGTIALGAYDLTLNGAVANNGTISGTGGVTIGGAYSGAGTINTSDAISITGSFMPKIGQVFTGAGTVTIGAGSVPEAWPEWWGVDGTADEVQINLAIASITATYGVVALGARTYNLADEVVVPEFVNIVGKGKRATYLKSTGANGRVRFGTKSGAFGANQRGGESGGFRIDGDDVGTDILHIGFVVERTFRDIDVWNSATNGMLIEAAQNCSFFGVDAQHNGTDDTGVGSNVKLDYGAGNNRFFGFEYNRPGKYNVEIVQTTYASPASPVGSFVVPNGNKWYSGVIERWEDADGDGVVHSLGTIYHGAGQNNMFFGTDISAPSLPSAFSIIKMRKDGTGTSSYLHFTECTFSGTQAYATLFDMDGATSAFISGKSYANGHATLFLMGDDARIYLDTMLLTGITTYFTNQAGATIPSYRAVYRRSNREDTLETLRNRTMVSAITTTTPANSITNRSLSGTTFAAGDVLNISFRATVSGTNNTKDVQLHAGDSDSLTSILTEQFSAGQTGVITFDAELVFTDVSGSSNNVRVYWRKYNGATGTTTEGRTLISVDLTTKTFKADVRGWVANASDSITVDYIYFDPYRTR
jgi:hypothetical protein